MSVVDVPALLDALKTALDNNNVQAGAPVRDLSLNMSRRVIKVATMDPREIRIGSTLLPAVCVFPISKAPTNTTIGPSRLDVKNSATLSIMVMGLVWNDGYHANIYDDKAMRDVVHLMENIERILRGNPQISSSTWMIHGEIGYDSVSPSEQTHFKVGTMNLEFKYFY